MCNYMEVLESMAHSEQYLKWWELGEKEYGDEWRGLERRGVERESSNVSVSSSNWKRFNCLCYKKCQGHLLLES